MLGLLTTEEADGLLKAPFKMDVAEGGVGGGNGALGLPVLAYVLVPGFRPAALLLPLGALTGVGLGFGLTPFSNGLPGGRFPMTDGGGGLGCLLAWGGCLLA